MSDQILEKLNEISGKLDELLLWKAAHQESHKIINRDLDEVRDTLFENPGLKSQVQTLINCKQNVSRWRNFWMDVLKFVVVAAIIAVLSWFLFLYKKGGLDEIDHTNQNTNQNTNQKEN